MADVDSRSIELAYVTKRNIAPSRNYAGGAAVTPGLRPAAVKAAIIAAAGQQMRTAAPGTPSVPSGAAENVTVTWGHKTDGQGAPAPNAAGVKLDPREPELAYASKGNIVVPPENQAGPRAQGAALNTRCATRDAEDPPCDSDPYIPPGYGPRSSVQAGAVSTRRMHLDFVTGGDA